MNTHLIAELVRLRYKLMWAKTRSRHGRVVLFIAGYVLLALLILLFAAGGLGAAFLAISGGQGEPIAQAIFGGLFLQSLITANLLGFGMNAVFADVELRRYPLSTLDRRIARHLIGIVDPFWALVLTVEVALAVGMSVLGTGNIVLGLIAVLLLFICNYLVARVIALMFETVLRRPGGNAVVLVSIALLSMLPAVLGPRLGPALRKNPALWRSVADRLHFTPPFGAAAAVVRADTSALLGLGNLLLWIAAFVALLVWFENRPPHRETAASAVIDWNSPFDRIGAIFGPRNGPFVSYWLRFYSRNTRTRLMYLISSCALALITYRTSSGLGPNGLFVAALGTLPIATFMSVARISVNQFGYVGGAFRRYCLLPTEPGAPLRTASYAALCLGLPMVPIGLLAWSLLSPGPIDVRMLIMLTCSALTGCLLLNTAGHWVTLYNPKRGKYSTSFGNDLSLGGNIVVVGSIVLGINFPHMAAELFPAAVAPEAWWMLLPLPVVAAAIYFASLKFAGAAFDARREILLSIVEGRD